MWHAALGFYLGLGLWRCYKIIHAPRPLWVPQRVATLRRSLPVLGGFPFTSRAMAPHMTTDELDFVVGLHAAGHLSVVQIHARLAAKRGRKGRA